MLINIDARTNEEIDSPDASLWRMVSRERVGIVYEYHVERERQTELEVVAEYDNGGKEYREKVVAEEVGRFTVTKDDGEPFGYPIDVPEGIPKDAPVPDIVDLVYWERYTKEEIAERDKAEAEARERAEAQAQLIESLPDTLASTDDAICMLYEMVLEGQNG